MGKLKLRPGRCLHYYLWAVLLAVSVPCISGRAQDSRVSGVIMEYRSHRILTKVVVSINGGADTTMSDEQGVFELSTKVKGEQTISFMAEGFLLKQYPLLFENEAIDLGIIFMERDLTEDKVDNLITLTEADLIDENGTTTTSGLLQATRDVFLNRAAFDFGQAFFRVRGYDSNQGVIMLNAIPLNRNWDGRPQWNNWGGLNDVTRNQEFAFGLEASENAFGGLLGSTNIDMRPSRARPGTRFSASASNRTYTNRLMATYHSGQHRNGWAYSLSASRRWAQQGYVQGTYYDAYSLFAALEYAISKKQRISLTMVNAYNSRGRSSALTEEVATLAGNQYNPYWGLQSGKIRSSRVRTIHEPIGMFNYELLSGNLRLRAGLAYQWGNNRNSRVGYFDAPNPDPTYYRNLPSYAINSPIGANFISAATARQAFLQDPQWPWRMLYDANRNEGRSSNAAYILYDDVSRERSWTGNILFNIRLGKHIHIDTGVTISDHKSKHFACANDLLGANGFQDRDPFSDTKNDLKGPLVKEEGQLFNYYYELNSTKQQAFLQTRISWKQWDTFLAGTFTGRKVQRNGLFLNERYPENSLGKSKTMDFATGIIKGGLTYRITSRHWVKAHALIGTEAPLLKAVFINPRENDQEVPDTKKETITSADLSYLMRLPKLTARFSGFYTRFLNTTDINFFYVDAGIGSDFVQEVVTELDRLHKGLEMGLEYQFRPSVKLSLVTFLGSYEFASDPRVTINYDTTGAPEGLKNTEGNSSLGIAIIKDSRLARGPQKAMSFGIEYRDPSYWWVGATANYLANNYIDISMINRTSSFKIDPETNQPFPEANEERIRALLAQRPLPAVYLLNLVGGKSWLHKGTYISLFASISNVFDETFRSGGYEQSRNGNYGQMVQDNLSGQPSFGPKFWFGFGRTYFLNLAYSF